MREGDEVDRAAWAKLLAELLAASGLTPEQAAAPIGPVNTSSRTIRRWLAKSHGATAMKVRDVSVDFGYPPVEALVRVGFLTPEQTRLAREPVTPAPPLPKPLRQIADILNNDRVPEEPKEQLRRAVQAAFDLWQGMMVPRAPKEPSARERTQGRSGK